MYIHIYTYVYIHVYINMCVYILHTLVYRPYKQSLFFGCKWLSGCIYVVLNKKKNPTYLDVH